MDLRESVHSFKMTFAVDGRTGTFDGVIGVPEGMDIRGLGDLLTARYASATGLDVSEVIPRSVVIHDLEGSY